MNQTCPTVMYVEAYINVSDDLSEKFALKASYYPITLRVFGTAGKMDDCTIFNVALYGLLKFGNIIEGTSYYGLDFPISGSGAYDLVCLASTIYEFKFNPIGSPSYNTVKSVRSAVAPSANTSDVLSLFIYDCLSVDAETQIDKVDELWTKFNYLGLAKFNQEDLVNFEFIWPESAV
eukprot:gene8077-10940_t